MSGQVESKRGLPRPQRFELQATFEQKALIERATALQGRTVTDFLMASAEEAARRGIEAQQLALSARDSQAFVEAMLRSKPVNSRLRDTVLRYRAATSV